VRSTSSPHSRPSCSGAGRAHLLHERWYEEKVDQPADAKEASGEKPNNTGDWSPDIEAMGAQQAQGQPKQVRAAERERRRSSQADDWACYLLYDGDTSHAVAAAAGKAQDVEPRKHRGSRRCDCPARSVCAIWLPSSVAPFRRQQSSLITDQATLANMLRGGAMKSAAARAGLDRERWSEAENRSLQQRAGSR
jgi:hypothetical protein